MIFQRAILPFMLAFLASLAGCASVGGAAGAQAAVGKSVAVASVAADSVVLRWVGTTVFNNEERKVPVASGKIDREMENTIVEVLRSTNRYSKVFALPARSSSPREALGSVGADYLLLVEAGAGADSRFRTNQFFQGIGLFQRSMFNSKPQAYGHVAVKLSLIEVSTGAVVSSATEVNSWPSEVLMSSGLVLSPEDTAALEKKLLYRSSGVVASALEPLGVR